MPINDLTGYSWVGNDNLGDISSYYYECSLNFISNNTNFDTFSVNLNLEYNGDDYICAYDGSNSRWVDNTYKTIQITGGTDTTNASLIAWLEENGTLTAPAPTTKKILKLNNKIVSKFNDQLIDSFNGFNIFAGIEDAPTVLPPILTLENNYDELRISPQNTGDEQYEIYINNTSIGILNQNYTFINSGASLTKCLGRQYYTGVITTPTEINGTAVTTLTSNLFSDCVASKIVISEGITTDNSNMFNSTTSTVNVCYPSTITKLNSLVNYPHNIIVGQEGYIEYAWTGMIPASAFAISKTISSATTFTFDVKSTITNIGNSAFNLTISGSYATTYNMYFRQPNNVTVTFGTTIIGTGSQKATRTYNIYTDNESVKTTLAGYAAQYTTVNVYKLDGSAW